MTRKLNLMLHCGAQHVNTDDVYDAPTPSNTKSHYPIAHCQLLDAVRDTVSSGGLQVVNEAHGLRDGKDDGLALPSAQYFGMLQIAADEGGEYSTVIGLRNSHDKTFSAELVLGAGVFVCDNLSFSGQVRLARKHTRFIQRDLHGLVIRAFSKLQEFKDLQDRRIAAYHEREISDSQAKEFIFDSMLNRTIGTHMLHPVWEQWREPAHPEFAERTLWSMFNAYTEVFKEKVTADKLPARTNKLHAQADLLCGLVTSA